MATQKIVNLGLLLVAVGAFLFLTQVVQLVWSVGGLPRMADWLVAPPMLVSFAVSAGGIVVIRQNAEWNRFLNEVVQELSKVTWPTRKETTLSTGVACVLVVICAAVLFLFDSLWGVILRSFF